MFRDIIDVNITIGCKELDRKREIMNLSFEYRNTFALFSAVFTAFGVILQVAFDLISVGVFAAASNAFFVCRVIMWMELLFAGSFAAEFELDGPTAI